MCLPEVEEEIFNMKLYVYDTGEAELMNYYSDEASRLN